MKITRSTACGELKIDDKAVEDFLAAAIPLPPGKHKIPRVGKEGFTTKTDSIVLVAGKPFEKEYKLVEKSNGPPAAAANPGPAAPAKPCGKFLKKCN